MTSRTGADTGRELELELELEKNMIFMRKIVIFHTKYPKSFHATLRPVPFF